MNHVVTDPYILEMVWDTVYGPSDSMPDMIADNSHDTAPGNEVHTVGVVYSDSLTGAYGFESLPDGQSNVYHFPDWESAEDWFDNVRPDL